MHHKIKLIKFPKVIEDNIYYFNGHEELNLKPEINNICKNIDKYKGNNPQIINIACYVQHNKKKLSLKHLHFICDYINDSLGEKLCKY